MDDNSKSGFTSKSREALARDYEELFARPRPEWPFLWIASLIYRRDRELILPIAKRRSYILAWETQAITMWCKR